jgi:hypothetical protein
MILSWLPSALQNSLKDDLAGIEDRHALCNVVIPGQTLMYAITEILTIPPPWSVVETYEHDQQDIHVQIKRDVHHFERGNRTDPSLTDHQSY